MEKMAAPPLETPHSPAVKTEQQEQQQQTAWFVSKRNVKSTVWTYFGFFKGSQDSDNVSSNPICKICFKEIPCKGGNTTNMRTHLRDHHPLQFRAMEAERARTNSTVAVTAVAKFVNNNNANAVQAANNKQSVAHPVPLAFDSAESKRITNAIGHYLGKDMLPLSIIEKAGFKQLLCELVPRYQLPHSAHFQQSVLPKLYNEVCDQVRAKLKQADTFALTTDMRTSGEKETYVNFCVHYITDEWHLENVSLGSNPYLENNNGVSVAEALENACTEWGLDCGNCVAGTTDNTSTYVVAFAILNKQRVDCFGHNVELAVEKGLCAHDGVKRALSTCRLAVDAFSRSWKRSRDFANRQIDLQLAQNPLTYDVPARWGTTVHMVNRFLEQQQAVRDVLAQDRSVSRLMPNDRDMQLLADFGAALTPLNDLNDSFGGGETHITLSELTPILAHIFDDLLAQKTSDTTTAGELKEAVKSDLQKRYNENSDLALLLNKTNFLDPRFKSLHLDSNRDIVLGAIKEEALAILSSSTPSLHNHSSQESNTNHVQHEQKTEQCNDLKRKTSLSGILHSVNKRKRFTSSDTDVSVSATELIDKEINSYLCSLDVDTDADPLAWWRANKSAFPRLAVLARKYLAIPATSVPAERLYSRCGLLVPPHRNEMKPDAVKEMVFLSQNLQ